MAITPRESSDQQAPAADVTQNPPATVTADPPATDPAAAQDAAKSDPATDKPPAAKAAKSAKAPPVVKQTAGEPMPETPSQYTGTVLGQDISKLPVIVDPGAVRALQEGALFIAKFAHDPSGDTGWQAKQQMKDLVSGRLQRHGLSPQYWNLFSHIRPPVFQKQGKKYAAAE